MTQQRNEALWIVGTSVSIEDGGYVTRLAARAAKHGIALKNLSVGDQTSVMGCMRVLDRAGDIAPGDTVVWEYGLLDTLLIEESNLPAADIHKARRLAWRCVLECGANLVVLLTAPKRHLRKRSACERRIAHEAEALGLPCVDTRDLCTVLGIADAGSHYRDDRHPRKDSPLVDAMVEVMWERVVAPKRLNRSAGLRHLRTKTGKHWRWIGAGALAQSSSVPLRRFDNSLLSIDAAALAVDARLALPPLRRIIGVGCISAHDSGGLWCGHPRCMPASMRLPKELPYSFLLRATTIPCLQMSVSQIICAPKHAYGCGAWADYGQVRCDSPGEIGVFGVLYETDELEHEGSWARLYSYLQAIFR